MLTHKYNQFIYLLWHPQVLQTYYVLATNIHKLLGYIKDLYCLLRCFFFFLSLFLVFNVCDCQSVCLFIYLLCFKSSYVSYLSIFCCFKEIVFTITERGWYLLCSGIIKSFKHRNWHNTCTDKKKKKKNWQKQRQRHKRHHYSFIV